MGSILHVSPVWHGKSSRQGGASQPTVSRATSSLRLPAAPKRRKCLGCGRPPRKAKRYCRPCAKASAT